jgi:hypothetical protein
MGKQTDDSRSNTENTDDYELKVLIDKCNVCHSNLDTVSTDHHKLCKHHGEECDKLNQNSILTCFNNKSIQIYSIVFMYNHGQPI